jgi:hypothetical protein
MIATIITNAGCPQRNAAATGASRSTVLGTGGHRGAWAPYAAFGPGPCGAAAFRYEILQVTGL